MKKILHSTSLLLLLPALLWAMPQQETVQFITNNGQITDQHYQVRTDVDVKIEAKGVTLFIGDGQLHYQWQQQIDSQHTEMYRMDVVLMGTNTHAAPLLQEPTTYSEHHYTAYTGQEGAHSIGYKKLTYKNIYPDIDWVLYVKDKQVKYDFVVHKGGNPADIQLQYNGAEDLFLKDGSLVAQTPMGSITEAAPYCYIANERKEVKSRYHLQGNILTFEVAEQEAALVIDPVIDWATYYGGSGGDYGTGVTTDAQGNVYMTGSTLSTANIATNGAYKTSLTNNGNYVDAMVVKFNESGVRQWATYYGGHKNDFSRSIAVDIQGNIYFCGYTYSDTGIATWGSHNSVFVGLYDTMNSANDECDGFLVKLDTGGARVWGTYYGYAQDDFIEDVACDDSGNVYICGFTGSVDGIASKGSFKDTIIYPNGAMAFLAKFNGAGVRQWGTYYVDSIGSLFFSIALDKASNLYVTGRFNSIGGTGSAYVSKHYEMTTPGAHLRHIPTSYVVAGLLVKFTPNGQRVWGTLTHDGSGYGVTTDEDANVYVTGVAGSKTYTVTPNGFDTSGNELDAFVAMFDSAGTRNWATYLGGSGIEKAVDITVGIDGLIYTLVGTTSDTGMAQLGAYQYSRSGSTDLFLASYNKAGTQVYGSYFGGTGEEMTFILGNTTTRSHASIAVSHQGKIFFSGLTGSSSNVATTGAHQTSFGGGNPSRDALLVCFYGDTVVYMQEPFTDTVLCPLDTVRIAYGVNLPFRSGNVFTAQLSNSTGSFASPVNIGTRTDVTGDTITCVIPKNTPAGTGYRIRVVSSTKADTSRDIEVDIRIKAAPAAFSNSSNSPVCEGDTIKLNGTSSSTGITWAWTGAGSFGSSAEDTVIANAGNAHAGAYILTATLNNTGCSFSDTTTVVIKDTPDTVVAGSNQPVCATKTLTLNASSATTGVSWSWTGPNTYSSNTQNPTVTTAATSSEAGSYIVTANLNGCTASDTTQVVVLPKPNKPTAGSNSPVCVNQNLELSATNITNAKYNWSGPALFSDTNQNAIRYQTQFAHAGTYYVFATVNGCASDTDSVVVTVNTNPYVTVFPTPGSTVCKDEEVTFTSVANNAGSTPAYKWLVNNTPTGSTGATYKTKTLNNGDIVTCEMISTGTCLLPFTDTSNAITMTVQALLTPQVSITANPNHTLFPNEPVTFTATPTDAGNNPTYQWTRNGTPISGATGAQWGANANFMSDGDEICAIVYSDYACPSPDSAKSNCITVKINVGVSNISKDSDINIYPNPVSNELHIDGATEGTEVTLYDVTGRTVYRNTITTSTHHINTRQLSAGSYVLVLTDKDGKRLQAKVNKW